MDLEDSGGGHGLSPVECWSYAPRTPRSGCRAGLPCRLRPRLTASCGEVRSHDHAKIGEGGGPEARSSANQALAASVSSCKQGAEPGRLDRRHASRRPSGESSSPAFAPRERDSAARRRPTRRRKSRTWPPASAPAGSRDKAAPGRRCSSRHAAAARRRSAPSLERKRPARCPSGTTPARSVPCARSDSARPPRTAR